MKSKYNIRDILDFVTNSDSELSDLSNDEDFVGDDTFTQVLHEEMSDSGSESDDDTPLIDLINQNGDENKENNDPNPQQQPKEHSYRWRKMDIPEGQGVYRRTFSDPPAAEKSPLDYFHMFFSVFDQRHCSANKFIQRTDHW